MVVRGLGVNLSTDLHLTPRIRMSGVIFLLSLYVLLAWTGTTLPSFALILGFYVRQRYQ